MKNKINTYVRITCYGSNTVDKSVKNTTHALKRNRIVITSSTDDRRCIVFLFLSRGYPRISEKREISGHDKMILCDHRGK